MLVVPNPIPKPAKNVPPPVEVEDPKVETPVVGKGGTIRKSEKIRRQNIWILVAILAAAAVVTLVITGVIF